MKRLLLLSILVAFALSSCIKNNDDTKDICTSDCTTFIYRFITTDSIGIPGIEMTLAHHESGGTFSASTRIIATGTSNADGIIAMNVYLQDGEINPTPGDDKYFSLTLNKNTLRKDLYFIESSNIIVPEIKRRDTIISKTLYYPLVNYITVHLNNFEPIKTNQDVFYIYNYTYGGGDNESIKKDNTFQVKVAPNKTNTLRITRRKNGIKTDEFIEIFVPKNNDITLTFDY